MKRANAKIGSHSLGLLTMVRNNFSGGRAEWEEGCGTARPLRLRRTVVRAARRAARMASPPAATASSVYRSRPWPDSQFSRQRRCVGDHRHPHVPADKGDEFDDLSRNEAGPQG